MDRIAAAGSKVRGVTSTRIPGGGGSATRVMFQRGAATVKVETSPVMRGVVFEPEFKRVSPAVEDKFGFAETRLVAFEDLFAGKLHAALDRLCSAEGNRYRCMTPTKLPPGLPGRFSPRC
jgi:hypothetical protein